MKGLSHYGSPFVARLSPRCARCPIGKNSPPDCFFRCFAPPSLFESLSFLNLFTIKKMKAPV